MKSKSSKKQEFSPPTTTIASTRKSVVFIICFLFFLHDFILYTSLVIVFVFCVELVSYHRVSTAM